MIARLDLGLLARPLSLPSPIHPSFPVLPGTQNDLIHWVENAIKLCWKKQSNGFSNYFLRRFSALGVILAVILRMGLSIAGGWALCPDHGMHPANTYTIPAPGGAGVLVSMQIASHRLYRFSVFVGSRARGTVHTEFSFLSFSFIGLK